MAFINKHTQGEWTTQWNSYSSLKYDIHKMEDGIIIGLVASAKTKEDAMLIAAAPKLRQCTEMLHDYLQGKDSFVLDIVKKVLIEAGVEIEPSENVNNIEVDAEEVKPK